MHADFIFLAALTETVGADPRVRPVCINVGNFPGGRGGPSLLLRFTSNYLFRRIIILSYQMQLMLRLQHVVTSPFGPFLYGKRELKDRLIGRPGYDCLIFSCLSHPSRQRF